MIKASDLRKGNLVRTEHGVRKVAYVIWNDVYVYGEDGRTLYVREVEGIGIGEFDIINQVGETLVAEVLRTWLFVHEMQNYFYWSNGKELKIEL